MNDVINQIVSFSELSIWIGKIRKSFQTAMSPSRTCNWKINIVWVMLSYVQKRILGSFGPWSTFEPLVWFNLQRYETIWRTSSCGIPAGDHALVQETKICKTDNLLRYCWRDQTYINQMRMTQIRLWNQKPKISNLPTSHLTKQ